MKTCTVKERFESKYTPVTESGCWLWEGSYLDKEGYGCFSIKRKTFKAHRISWEIYNGPIPDGLCVCHHCDTPECVNPDHLFIGTHKDNMQDCSKKGRIVPNNNLPILKGEKHPRSKLKEYDVRWIRSAYKKGFTRSHLARLFNVGPTCIDNVINYLKWKHI